MNDVYTAFRHYADFAGRMSRKAFWNFIGTTHSLFILLLLPPITAFLEWTQTVLESPLVLDALVAIMENPVEAGAIVQGELLPELQAEATDFFLHDFPATHPVATLSLALAVLWMLALAVPTLSATVRRLRDAGQSPFWVLAVPLSCIPEPFCSALGMMLSLVLLVLCLQPTKALLAPPPPAGEQGRKSA